MTLSRRIAATAFGAVMVAVLLAVLAAYFSTSRALQAQVDDALRREGPSALRDAVRDLQHGEAPGGGRFGGARPGRQFGGPGYYQQLVDAEGNVVLRPRTRVLPVTGDAATFVREQRNGFSTVRVDGEPIRVMTIPFGALQINGASVPLVSLQLARSLGDVEGRLHDLRNRLLMISVGALGLAALLGRFVARRSIQPVLSLTQSVERVTETQDLSHRIDVNGSDEPARLATAFNELLASLDTARRSQDQLIADASHELRTPLTALRANVELLASGAQIDPHERSQMASDLASQLDQFGELIGGLVELARGDKPPERFELLRLDDLASDSVARARALWPTATFTLSCSATSVNGDRDQLERAVRNLLDNAARYAGSAGPIDVRAEAGEVSVRDHGPGVPEEERARIFERFHRGAGVRAVPGSGLGLAIVAQITRAHGGSVIVEAADGGGALFRLRLPNASPPGEV